MDTAEKLLCFEIDQRRFAFDVKNVLEVLINREIYSIPQSADYIVGLVNFRGEVVTVVDTSIKFGIKNHEIENKKIIIVISIHSENKTIKLGCLCDNVLSIESINPLDIQIVPNFGTYYKPELLKGVFYINHELYSIVDIEKVFSTEEVLLLEEVRNK